MPLPQMVTLPAQMIAKVAAMAGPATQLFCLEAIAA